MPEIQLARVKEFGGKFRCGTFAVQCKLTNTGDVEIDLTTTPLWPYITAGLITFNNMFGKRPIDDDCPMMERSFMIKNVVFDDPSIRDSVQWDRMTALMDTFLYSTDADKLPEFPFTLDELSRGRALGAIDSTEIHFMLLSVPAEDKDIPILRDGADTYFYIKDIREVVPQFMSRRINLVNQGTLISRPELNEFLSDNVWHPLYRGLCELYAATHIPVDISTNVDKAYDNCRKYIDAMTAGELIEFVNKITSRSSK